MNDKLLKNPDPLVKCQVEYITVARCRMFYSKSIGNRKESKAFVDKFAREMKAGKWKMNGQTIVVSNKGNLLDGHHRCLAGIKSGTGFWSVCIYGVDESVFDTIDSGKARSFVNTLQILGCKNGTTASATITRLMEYFDGILGAASTHSYTTQEKAELLAEYPEIEKDITFCQQKGMSSVMSASQLVWLYVLVKINHPEKANSFIKGIATGEMLSADDPIFQFRAKMLANRASTKKMQQTEVLAFVIKAWNFHLKGKRIKSLRWVKTNGFPKIQF